MSFEYKKCKIPTTYCGTESKLPKSTNTDSYYVRKGQPYECLQKGVGIGIITTELKGLPVILQDISSMWEKYIVTI